MNFDPVVFGEGFHRFVQKEMELLGSSLGVVFHLVTFIVLFLTFRYGNKYRKVFVIWFGFIWIFLFGYWGVYGSVYWFKTGIPYLAVYAITPVLLGLIVFNWIKETIHPLTDLNLKSIQGRRFLVLGILVWGVWYPTYIYGQGFVFKIGDLVLSNYGLMPCPTTMVVLSLMTLKYPQVNKKLYILFTVYALFIGTATVLSGWLPDVPFIVLGIYSAGLMASGAANHSREKRSGKRRWILPGR